MLPNLKHSSQRSGFTLIELMVSIVIITILATVGFVTYSNSQMYARDAKRKQDLKALATALEVYYQDYKHYPCSAWSFSSNTPGTAWVVNNSTLSTNCGGLAANQRPFTSNYINYQPNDPKSNGGQPYNDNGWGYGYWSNTTGAGCTPIASTIGQTYILVTQLENKNDPDRVEINNQTWCNNPLYVSGGTGTIPSRYSFVIINN